MKEQIILNITQEMLPYLDNAQLLRFQKVLERNLWNVEITENSDKADTPELGNGELLTAFINANMIEGCSEKTLKYYQSTINKMLSDTDKHITHITTDDLSVCSTKAANCSWRASGGTGTLIFLISDKFRFICKLHF